MMIACIKHDHPFKVRGLLCMTKTGLEELEQFKLTRSEYAKRIGKTPNAVRMMMRHGKLTGQFRFDGKKFLFKEPKRPRENYDDHPTQKQGLTTPKLKKTYNRGNHFNAVKEGKYPNDAFKLYNENKKRMAQLNELNGKFKSEDHKNEFMRLNSIALKEAEKKVMEKAKNTPTPGQFKNYGSMLSHRGLEIRRSMDIDRVKLDSGWSGSRSVFFGSRRNPYEPGAGVDDGSVEVDISRSNSSNDLNSMPRFSSKVQEEIWKLKNKK